jgi:hypothetical protein
MGGALGVAAWRNLRAWRRQTTAQQRQPTPSRSTDGWTGTPKVSVLVPAWNEAALIAGHIQSFKQLSYPSLQMVLCAGGDDGTYEIAKDLADNRIIVLEQLPGEGKQRALGRCLGASDGEIIMLSDADCLLADEPFRVLIGPIARGETDVATGYRLPLRELQHHDFVRFQWFSEQASIAPQVNALWGGNCAFRRAIGEGSNALNLPAPTGTDYVQGRALINAGSPIRWIPESQVETRYPTSAGGYVRISRRWIKNAMIYGPRFGDWHSVFQMLIAIGLASGMLLPPLIAPLAGRVALAVPFTCLAVATMNRMRRIAVGAHAAGVRPSWRLFAAAPMFTLLDQLAVMAAVVDVFSRRGRTRW